MTILGKLYNLYIKIITCQMPNCYKLSGNTVWKGLRISRTLEQRSSAWHLILVVMVLTIINQYYLKVK